MRSIGHGTRDEIRRRGFVILENFLDNEELATLQHACNVLLEEPPDDDKGGQAHNIGRGEDRRFLRHRHTDIESLAAFVLGDNMRTLAGELISAHPYLFNEQFVVKGRAPARRSHGTRTVRTSVSSNRRFF
ncbi:MAG: hypothetical protein AAFM91_13610 [Pseudomonadota bacterium]